MVLGFQAGSVEAYVLKLHHVVAEGTHDLGVRESLELRAAVRLLAATVCTRTA